MNSDGVLLEYDAAADVLYVSLCEARPGGAKRTREIDERRRIDFDADGRPIGVEFGDASDGVLLDGVPAADEIRRALRAMSLVQPTA